MDILESIFNENNHLTHAIVAGVIAGGTTRLYLGKTTSSPFKSFGVGVSVGILSLVYMDAYNHTFFGLK